MSARSAEHPLYEVDERQGVKAALAAGKAPYEGLE